jgi:hypothetical protein
VVAACRLLDDSSALSAPSPSPVEQMFLHGLLLKVFPARADVRMPPAQHAGAAPAGRAEADVCEFVDLAGGNVFAALAVAAEQFVPGGIVCLGIEDKLQNLWIEFVHEVGVVEVQYPRAAPWWPELSVLASMADQLVHAVLTPRVATRRSLHSDASANVAWN